MGGRRWNPELVKRLRTELLHWYSTNRRDLPWRRTQDPYAIWVSEIMLQQTRVAAVVEKYAEFLKRFPTVEALAAAPEQDVLALWSGLGYYRRARMLHRAAQQVARELGGVVPLSAAELRKLPGIGSYTAAAIASIAHGEPIAVVDGNVERVLARLEGLEATNAAEGAKVRRKVEALAAELVDDAEPGDFNQAIMELGATVCTPRTPQCLTCPWLSECATRGEHKTVKRAPMTVKEVACALVARGDQVLLEQRSSSQTVMAEMWQLPFLRDVVVPGREPEFAVRHAIMQVNYVVKVFALRESEVKRLAVKSGSRCWISLEQAGHMALTGVCRKILKRAGLLRALQVAEVV